jgi:hypothetical protein
MKKKGRTKNRLPTDTRWLRGQSRIHGASQLRWCHSWRKKHKIGPSAESFLKTSVLISSIRACGGYPQLAAPFSPNSLLPELAAFLPPEPPAPSAVHTGTDGQAPSTQPLTRTTTQITRSNTAFHQSTPLYTSPTPAVILFLRFW